MNDLQCRKHLSFTELCQDSKESICVLVCMSYGEKVTTDVKQKTFHEMSRVCYLL